MTGQEVQSHGKLIEEDVYFDLSRNQRNYFDMVQRVNTYVREEYHSVHNILWNSGFFSASLNMPPRYVKAVNIYIPNFQSSLLLYAFFLLF